MVTLLAFLIDHHLIVGIGDGDLPVVVSMPPTSTSVRRSPPLASPYATIY